MRNRIIVGLLLFSCVANAGPKQVTLETLSAKLEYIEALLYNEHRSRVNAERTVAKYNDCNETCKNKYPWTRLPDDATDSEKLHHEIKGEQSQKCYDSCKLPSTMIGGGC